VLRLLPILYRLLRSYEEVQVVLLCISLVSSKRLTLLGIHLCMHRQRYIFLVKIQELSISSHILQVLHGVRLGQELYRFLHIVHIQYISAHLRLVKLLLAFLIHIKTSFLLFKPSPKIITRLC